MIFRSLMSKDELLEQSFVIQWLFLDLGPFSTSFLEDEMFYGEILMVNLYKDYFHVEKSRGRKLIDNRELLAFSVGTFLRGS